MTQVAVGTSIDHGHCGNISIEGLDVGQNFLFLVILSAYHESCWLLWQQFPMPPFRPLHTEACQDTLKNPYPNSSLSLFISKLLATFY